MLVDVSSRKLVAEQMDDLDIPYATLKKTFKDINNCNRYLNGNVLTVKAVSRLMAKHPKEMYKIVDLGCGDGQLLRELVHNLKKKNIKVAAVGLDIHPKAIEIAKEASKDYPEISYEVKDIVLTPVIEESDIVLCTLTLHHFTDQDITKIITKSSKSAKIGIVINDLHRSALAYYLFKVFSFFFIKTAVAKSDGLISIRRGFKKMDIIKYSKLLTTAQHSIHWKWAFRYIWIIQTTHKR